MKGGVRTACIIRWPNRFEPGKVCREPIANIDLFSLALNAAKVPLPEDRVIDGRDPSATLAGDAPSPHEYIYFEYRKWSGARNGRWKIVRSRPERPFELYDLSTDWSESRNLAEEMPDRLNRMAAAFDKWRSEFPR